MTRDLEQLRAEHRNLAAAAESARKAAQDVQTHFMDAGCEVAYRAACEDWFAADDLASRAWLAVLEAEARLADGAA